MDAATLFWSRLRGLVAREGPPSPLPAAPCDYLARFRRRLALRESAETRALFGRLARLAGERIQAVWDAEFRPVLSEAELGATVHEAFADLFDGGLARFRGGNDADLQAFVEARADRVLLRAVTAEWARHEARATWRTRYGDLLDPQEAEETAAEAVREVVGGALHGFRGESAAELYGFVRTVASRTVGRAARRKLKDRDGMQALRAAEPDADVDRLDAGSIRWDNALPISDADRDYLAELLAAGGNKAALARARGVGRSAVTKMVQRILVRLDELEEEERRVVGEWARETWEVLQTSTG